LGCVLSTPKQGLTERRPNLRRKKKSQRGTAPSATRYFARLEAKRNKRTSSGGNEKKNQTQAEPSAKDSTQLLTGTAKAPLKRAKQEKGEEGGKRAGKTDKLFDATIYQLSARR